MFIVYVYPECELIVTIAKAVALALTRYRSLNTALVLVAFEYDVPPEGGRFSLTTPRPRSYYEAFKSIPSVSRRRPYLINLIKQSYYEKAKSAARRGDTAAKRGDTAAGRSLEANLQPFESASSPCSRN